MIFKDISLLTLLIFAIFIANNENLSAQDLPVISYDFRAGLHVDSAISPLSPTNKGGAVFPVNYNKPTSFIPCMTPFSVATDGLDNVYTTNNSTGDLTKYNSDGTAIFTINTGDINASETAVDKLGNIYVSQFSANAVLKYNSSGTLLATFTGFSDPYGIAFDASNNAYVANYLSGKVLKIDAYTSAVSDYLTGFKKLYGIVMDDSGNMYVSEQGSGDIIKVEAGTLTRTVFATGFSSPRHLNKDAFGNIYVADFGNNAIKRIGPDGKVTTILNEGLNQPRQAAFNSTGDLLIADYGSNSLLKSVATSYSISGSLPPGLNFDTLTGQITGTPTAPDTTTCTIIAYNTRGADSTALTLAVTSAQPDTASILNTLSASLQDKIIVHQAVSPNGDGISDFLLIEGIENFPVNKINILNKSGVTVFEVKGYDNSNNVFDGHSNVDGRLLPAGTYFYVLEYDANGKTARKTGFIMLKRR